MGLTRLFLGQLAQLKEHILMGGMCPEAFKQMSRAECVSTALRILRHERAARTPSLFFACKKDGAPT